MEPPSSHPLATPRGGRPPAARQSRFRGGKLGLVLALLGGALYAVVLVHAAGQTLLALTLLVVLALALWTYTSKRTNALRYLFPGVAAAVIFVVFPMLYTVGIGFTNYSSRNLLDHEAARAYLLDEAVPVPGSERSFSLHAEGAGRVRLFLGAPEGGGSALQSEPLDLAAPPTVVLAPADAAPGPALALQEIASRLDTLRSMTITTPEGARLRLASLSRALQLRPLFTAQPDGSLKDGVTGIVYRRDDGQGFYTSTDGDLLQPGYRVAVGLRHYATIFSEGRFREPFAGVFLWTVVFSALSIVLAAGLGLLLASLLNWPALAGKGAYRLVLFLPYAVPGFISILVFKGLFNQNLGEINFILNGLFGIRPAWFSDPTLARTMLLIVNVWLGFPYMMVLCSGLIQSIPADLYEASAVAGAGPLANFRHITLPLILKPLTPLLISAFAFNFNNFVLVSLLTGGRPDRLDSPTPAGTTDILVSYTWRIAFGDSGQQFGLAAAISTVIFLIVAAITLLQLRFTKPAGDEARR